RRSSDLQSDIEQAEKRYRGELFATLMRHAQDTYPRMAQRRNWQGRVTIEFTLLANGDIVRVHLIDSSGRTLLDEAAMSIFSEKMKHHFKPFPEQINRREWTLSVPIEYKLR
ncbi:MAG: energy transducer TonB, partial [Thiomicrospira sp.]|nr:energy transducer TonB [Thiomicrospira sp.]